MQIEYENTFTDILLFNAAHQFLSLPVQLLYLIAPVFIFASEIIQDRIFIGVISAIIAYVVLWLIQLIFNVFYMYSKKDHAILTKHIVEISEASFNEETKYSKSQFYWNGVVKVVERIGFVAVYVTAHAAHIIPNRAFNSKEHRKEFVTAIRHKVSQNA